MLKILSLFKFLSKNEKISFIFIFFGVFFCTFLEGLSFAAIIPVFQFILSGEKINIFFFNQLELNSILILFLLLFSFKNLFLIFFNYFYIKFIHEFLIDFSNTLFLKNLNHNYSFFKKYSHDYFLRKVSTDVQSARVYVVSCIVLISEILFVVILSAILMHSDFVVFAVVMIFFLAVIFLYFYLIRYRIKKWADTSHVSTGKLQSIVYEGLNGIKDIKTYNIQNLFYEKFSTYTKNIFTSAFKVEFISQVQRYWMELLCISIFVSSLIFITYLGQQIIDFFPILTLYAVAIFRLIPSFNKIVNNKNAYKFFYPGFKSVIEQLNNADNFSKSVKENSLNFQKFLELKNVYFKFEGMDNFLINNLNLKIKKNSSILIKGLNGSGKSTLLDIISGLRDPSKGDVLIDGKHNLMNCKAIWMKKIAYVHQNVFIMNSSIINNITFDDLYYDKIKFKNISNLLKLEKLFDNFHELINKKNVRFDKADLSGGQKQLISIARALYKDSEVLILDEPDSALDVEKNKILLELLVKLRGTKTIIMISHNLSYDNNIFDNILEMNNDK
jgi:ABC-type bacteriocin/lantibiotic exporter with double-glycine peptidase domain